MELPPVWVIQVITLMVCAFGLMIYFFYLRSKFQGQARDHVLCEFITEEGTSHTDLLQVVDGFVLLKGNKKKDKKDKDYPVAEVATFLSEYPEGWVPRFLKTPIRKTLFREDTWEPIFNRGDPLLSPALLHSIRTEKFTELGARHALEEGLLESKLRAKEKLNPMTVYLLLGTVAVVVVALAVFMYVEMSGVNEILDKLKKALGV